MKWKQLSNAACQFRPVIAVIVGVLGIGAVCHTATGQTISVSGVVTSQGGSVVEGASVAAISLGQSSDETVTDSRGAFSLSLTPGSIQLHVVPPLATRLVARHMSLGNHDASFTHDVTVAPGALLAGTLTVPGGGGTGRDFWIECRSLGTELSDSEWTGTPAAAGSGAFQVVVPFDVHWVGAADPWPYYGVFQPVDLSSGDVTGVTLTLSRYPVNDWPTDPPDASLISVGTVDDLGEATVSGAAGSVAPFSIVMVVNMDSSNQASAASAADGSFSTKVFAPQGSRLLIRHGPPGFRWTDLDTGVVEGTNPFPATIVSVPFSPPGGGSGVWFATVGATKTTASVVSGGAIQTVGGAWQLAGTLSGPGDGGLRVTPGATLSLEGTVRVWSQAISSSMDLGTTTVFGGGQVALLFDSAGEQIPLEPLFMSSTLTPSGFPVQRSGRSAVGIGGVEPTSGFQLVGPHAIEVSVRTDLVLPDDLPTGVYQPRVLLEFEDMPRGTTWIAATVFGSTKDPNEAVLPPVFVEAPGHPAPANPRLTAALLMTDVQQGTRGTLARADRNRFALATQIVTQGAPYIAPPVDRRSGRPFSYRIEPFLPAVSFTDRRVPTAPVLSLDLPGGRLHVQIDEPGGVLEDLGSARFSEPLIRTETTAVGADVNNGTTQLDDVYSLTTGDDAFHVSFERFGHHVIEMEGEVSDVFGNNFNLGGVYDLWVAYPLDLEPGVLAGTPIEAGQAISSTVQVYPRVPADVTLTFTAYADSDPQHEQVTVVSGTANAFGYFASSDAELVPSAPGEYRVDLTAAYTTPEGELYMAARTWGGVVMTPAGQGQLVAHGRRGVDCQSTLPGSWFVSSRDLSLPAGSICHTFNSYFSGDILWSRLEDGAWGGDALLAVGTVQDTVGNVQAAIEARLPVESEDPLMSERLAAGELPLFIATASGRSPPLDPQGVTQIAYSYRSSQRPGERVREVVSEDNQNGGYWRLDTQYDRQLGVGILGDQANDFKFQFAGTVFRDLETGYSEYDGHGSVWVNIPPDDSTGSRAMPPFSGDGNDGWTTEGGPILTLNGQPIDMFVLPTGAGPGAVLEVGDTFSFSGHIAPTLDSTVEVTVTSPTGTEHIVDGRANRVGYFYDPNDDFAVDEPGLWSVDVKVWGDGRCSGGQTVAPYPSGDVLGSDSGRYWVYVVPAATPPLQLTAPSPGFMTITDTVPPLVVRGLVPPGVENASVDYTIRMPGYILEHGQVTPASNTFSLTYDPATLGTTFPNLDLIAKEAPRPGLADTVLITMLLTGTRNDLPVIRAASLTLQGEQVLRRDALGAGPHRPPRRAMGRVEGQASTVSRSEPLR